MHGEYDNFDEDLDSDYFAHVVLMGKDWIDKRILFVIRTLDDLTADPPSFPDEYDERLAAVRGAWRELKRLLEISEMLPSSKS